MAFINIWLKEDSFTYALHVKQGVELFCKELIKKLFLYSIHRPPGMYLHWRNDAVLTGWLYVVRNFANIGRQNLNICRDVLWLSAVAIELF